MADNASTTNRSERIDMETVKIFDTTLRDGEQSPGISLDVTEKLEIAEQLARLGVDVIEAGFPIASDGDFDSVEAIAKAVRGPIIAGLSRTGFKDVDRAWEAIEGAAERRIHIFIATSETHMKHKLRMTPEHTEDVQGRPVVGECPGEDLLQFGVGLPDGFDTRAGRPVGHPPTLAAAPQRGRRRGRSPGRGDGQRFVGLLDHDRFSLGFECQPSPRLVGLGSIVGMQRHDGERR